MPQPVILSPLLGEGSPAGASDSFATSRLFGQDFRPKSRDKAFKTEILREILRPKHGLMMTVIQNPAIQQTR
ncbi:MAG: hypothetical protein DMG61_13170 [Acidobacteria bacterium]|nr:MAG: hypothetical protein DMG61_13170 [Acidobacteriota bacterium]PYY14526.1 MAG: hypothetical protein DMG60_19895 [Acidobacteriota bacterium]